MFVLCRPQQKSQRRHFSIFSKITIPTKIMTHENGNIRQKTFLHIVNPQGFGVYCDYFDRHCYVV